MKKKIIIVGLSIIGIIVILFGIIFIEFLLKAGVTKGVIISSYSNPKSALLIIDLQRNLTERDGKMILNLEQSDQAIVNVNKVINKTIKLDIDVIYITNEWKKSSIANIVTGGLDKIAVRIPDNKIALELLSSFGPITATSANIHGLKTPDNINEINMQFKENVAIYLDNGRLEGRPSTIIDLTDTSLRIIRQGAIPEKDILDAI